MPCRWKCRRAGWQPSSFLCAVATALCFSKNTCGSGVGSPNVGDTCSLEEFKEALTFLTSPQVHGDQSLLGTPPMAAEYNSQIVIDRYANFHLPKNSCALAANPLWPRSKRKRQGKQPLIINLAEGSTATRFLGCIFRKLGYWPAHGEHFLFTDCGTAWNAESRKEAARTQSHQRERRTPHRRRKKTCKFNTTTEDWDQYDYVADSPVAYFVDNLALSHPDSPFLLGVRDPKMWHQRRRDEHLPWSLEWVGAHPCTADWQEGKTGGTQYKRLEEPDAWVDFVVYNAWVACVIPRDNLLVYNLFSGGFDAASNEHVVRQIVQFLLKHNIKKNAHRVSIRDMVATCRGSGKGTGSLKAHPGAKTA